MATDPTMKRVAYHSAIRSPNARVKRGCKKGYDPFWSGSGSEDLPHPPDGMQQFLLERPIDLLSQTAHQDVDHVGLRVEAVVPAVGQDHGLRHDPTDIAHQILEEREFPRAQ